MRELQINGREIHLVQGDITTCRVDAIVNAANSGLRGGGGVDGAIHRAGGPTIMAECRQIGSCPTGQACVTSAGDLHARYVIHAVGPVWQGGAHGEQDLLASAYRRSLEVAEERKVETVAFPSISTGVYGYPVFDAAQIALKTVAEHLRQPGSVRSVTFVLFTPNTLVAYEKALDALAALLRSS